MFNPSQHRFQYRYEAQVPEGNEIATVENIYHVAMLLFAEYIDAVTSMSESCGDGDGSAPESGWRKKNDEDERMFAEERRRVQKRYKEYDGCYLEHYAQWFGWFFFVLGFSLFTWGMVIMVGKWFNWF